MTHDPEAAFARSGRIVWIIVALLSLIHGVRSLLDPISDFHVLSQLAFIPAQFTQVFDSNSVWREIEQILQQNPGVGGEFAAFLGSGPHWWSPLTYSLLHGDFSHLAMNCFWLLAFGVAVARRFGSGLFILFFAFAAVIGVCVHYAVHPLGLEPVIGASAAVSGAMGAAVRFAFAPGAPLGGDVMRMRDLTSYRLPAPPFSAVFTERRALTFTLFWFASNLIFGFAAPAFGPAGASIAWEAHIGGFLSGFIGFGLFDGIAARHQRRFY